MAATPSIKIVKSMPFEGGTKVISNRYHFSGGTPSGSGPWTTLADAIVADEAPIYPSDVTITEAIGYGAGSDLPLFTKAYTTVGSLTPGGSDRGTPLWCCALARYATTQFTSKHHPIYLFNYFHRVFYNNGATLETLASGQKSAIEEYCDDWLAGFSDGTNTYVRSGPNGAVAQSRVVNQFITHRDFPT